MSDDVFQARPIRRRLLLQRAAALGVLAAGGSLLAACQSAGSTQTPAKPTESKPAETKPADTKPAAPAAETKPAAAGAPQVAAATVAPAKPIAFHVRNLNTTPVIDAQQAFTSVGNHKRLGFYAQDGLTADYVGLQGAETVLQALAVGRAETGTYNPLNVFPAEARGQGLPLKVIYLQHQRAYWEVRVNEDSPIKEYKDLAGKKIGIIREGDTGPNAAKFHLRQVGIDPDKDVTWPVVGQGASAGQALKNGAVDALAIWDAEFARMELLGFKLRQIPNPGNADKLFGFGVATRANLDWKEHIPKFIRGYIKSTIFTITNPEAAIRLHWDLYPDSKPTGIPEAQAIQEQMFIINVRAPWYGPRTADGKSQDLMGTWCYSDPARWDAWVEFLGLQDKIKDTKQFYTNEFIEEANNFDKAAVIQMAKEFKY